MKIAGYAIAIAAGLAAYHLGVAVPFFVGGLVAIVFVSLTADENNQ